MTTTVEPTTDDLDLDEPCSFDADDFLAIYDRLLDRLAGMHLPDGMGLREAIAAGYVSRGAIEDAIEDAWGRW